MLEDLLEQFDISLEDFRKKGRCHPEITVWCEKELGL